ncbi:MAG: DUF5716 family protein [Lachnospiraceae bacterium]|nr:DUF5716 family protein [Lachnospiraceae bacterium]MDD3616569.1 DUF5716 family protein [Lachnospiraceae bacterium]
MEIRYEIPDKFWGLFRSVNREIYIEALLKINEEYEYNNYYLSREVCISVLSDYFSKSHIQLEQDELETDLDLLEPLATRVLNWLLNSGWLKKLDDYTTLITNILIPDYAAIFIEAFERLTNDEMEDTEIYIQNIYANLFSFRNDSRGSLSLLKTALINTRKLNKVLQDMLHNMDKFFASLLEQKFYGELLKEHLDGYVEEIVRKKYHILKTSDNFYQYKSDIKKWLNDMREEPQWMDRIIIKNAHTITEAEIYELIDRIERGFDDIEHRIANMDREHSKYVRATVTRLNYLLSGEDNTKGLVIQLLNEISMREDAEETITQIGSKMNLASLQVLTPELLYKKRKPKIKFEESLSEEVVEDELSMEEVLKLNRIHRRYSMQQIEAFIEEHMVDGKAVMDEMMIQDEESFEKMILAYDDSARKHGKFRILDTEAESVDNGKYVYPKLTFVNKKNITEEK